MEMEENDRKFLTVNTQKGLYVAFVDFARAFDSIPHSILWYRLLNDGMHGNIIMLFRNMDSQLKSCVNTFSGLTDFFNCTVGTRQWCVISPFIFA
jgi:hypothetical protein